MGDWKEECLRRKYAPTPEEPPRHKKKRKKRNVRSDHKHDYEHVCVDTHSCTLYGGKRHPYLHDAERCTTCGRLRHVTNMPDDAPRPDGMRLFVVDDYLEFVLMKYLPDSKEVSEL